MPNFRNPSTPHCHQMSLDTGSTPEAFADREIELGTGTLTCTDHGSMAASITVYTLAKKNNLVPILGIEGYLRDKNDPVLTADGQTKDENGEFLYNYFDSDRPKYTHFTAHYLDQQAFSVGAKLLSRAPTEQHGSEEKPIFTWDNMEEMGAANTVLGSGCLIGVCQRHLMAGRPDLAEKYYERYRSLAKPGNFIVEVFPHECTHNWIHGVFVQTDKDSRKFWRKKKLKTNKNDEITAQDLAREFKNGQHTRLLGVYNNRVLEELDEELQNAEYIEDFIQNECSPDNPTGDVQWKSNLFVMDLAKRYGDPCIWSDDSHVSEPKAKIVQDVRLAQSGNWKFHTSYHRKSGDELWTYAQKVLKMSERDMEEMLENASNWAGRFKDFKLEYKPSLPGKFYPEDTLGYLFKLIQERGRMKWGNKIYEDRLKKEIDMIHKNGTIDLLTYFFPPNQVLTEYNRKGFIVSPGRGSSAGLLICFLIGITHVDPIETGLSMERFLTLDRIKNKKLPDIDMDLPHKEYLVGKVEKYIEVEMEDGSLRKYLSEASVKTVNGPMNVREAIKYQVDILED